MLNEQDTTIPTDLTIAIGRAGHKPSKAFQILDGKLILSDDMDWAEYVNGMSFFKRLTDDLKLYRSQYVAFGHLKFGKDKVNNCMAQLEFELEDVRKDIEVASIPDEVRQDGLKAEHYTTLARSGLKKPQMAKWAKIAAEKNLTPGQLKASIATGEVVTESQARAQNSGILSLHGIAMELEIWLRRAGGLDELRKKPADQRAMLADQIKIACDIHAALTAATKAKAPRKPTKGSKTAKRAKKAAK